MGGCFLGCFKSFSKETKNPYHRKIKLLPQYQENGTYEPLQSGINPESDTNAKPGNQILLIKEDRHEELLSLSIPKKDILGVNVQKFEAISIKEDKHEEQSSLSIRKNNSFDAVKAQLKEDKHEEQSSLSIRKNNSFDAVKAQLVPIEESMLDEQPPTLRIRKKVKFDANVKTYEPIPVIESTEVLADIIQDNETQKEELSEKPNLPCYPINHRYNNCEESDEELDELETQESYKDDEDGEYTEDDLESYYETVEEMSCFDMREKKTVGLGQCGQDRGVYLHPMLNPVENLDEWNSLKTKIKTQPKTNIIEDQHREVAVDASLSNWLVSSETTNNKSIYDGFELTSQKISTEDRSILGASTMEEERKTTGLMSDEMLTTNSIGTYQNYSWPQVKDIGAAFSYKRLPNITNKYPEVVSC